MSLFSRGYTKKLGNLKNLDSGDVTALSGLVKERLYSAKNEADDSLKLSEVYSELGISGDAGAKKDVKTYLRLNKGLKISGDEITYDRKGEVVKEDEYHGNFSEYVRTVADKIKSEGGSGFTLEDLFTQVENAHLGGSDLSDDYKDEIRGIVFKYFKSDDRGIVQRWRDRKMGRAPVADDEALKPKKKYLLRRALGGAGAGAAAGSALGPIGAAVGAVLGGLGASTYAGFGCNRERRVKHHVNKAARRKYKALKEASEIEEEYQDKFSKRMLKDAARLAEKEADEYEWKEKMKKTQDLILRLLGKEPASADEESGEDRPGPGPVRSPESIILESLEEYWQENKGDWEFGRIVNDFSSLSSDVGLPAMQVSVVQPGSYTYPLNDGSNRVDNSDHLLYTHSLFGYQPSGNQSLVRSLLDNLSSGTRVNESKVLLGELAEDVRKSLSEIYGDEWETVLGKNLTEDGVLKDNAIWTRFKYNARDSSLSPTEARGYERYEKDITESLRRIRKYEGTMMGLMGLLTGEDALDDEDAELLFKKVSEDLEIDRYDFSDPAHYAELMRKLEEAEDDLDSFIDSETGSGRINSDFGQAKDARKRTEKVAEILGSPSAALSDYDLAATGVMDCGSGVIDTTDVTLEDIKKYLYIREQYLHRDMRAAWALALLKKAGKI